MPVTTVSPPHADAGPPGAAPGVSVIVPVRNDARRLRRCLDALAAQSLARNAFEVIVVDNGSTDDSARIARSCSGVRLLFEPAPGSYAARNAGLEAAKGELVAFTDSDCIPEPDWLANLLAAAERHPGFGAIAGHVEFFRAGEAACEACFHFERLFLMDQQANARKGHCVTANWLSPARTLREFGGFNGALQSGGDFELAGRLAGAGLKVIYAPRAVVRHPARRSTAEVEVKIRRITRGLWDYTPMKPRLPALYLLYTMILAKRVLTAVSTAKLTWRQRPMVLRLLVFTWAVTLAELARLQFQRREGAR